MTQKDILRSIAGYTVVAALLGLVLTVTPVGAATSAPSVTIRVDFQDMPKLAAIKPQSRVDYGSFSLIEVSRNDLPAIKAARVRVSEENSSDTIGLQGREFSASAKTITGAKLTGPGLYLVHTAGPTKRAWLDELAAPGAKIVSYIPQNSYLVWIDPATVPKLDKKVFIRWKDAYRPALKVSPAVKAAKGTVAISVTIYGETDGKVVDSIKFLGAKFIRQMDSKTNCGADVVTAFFQTDASIIAKIAAIPNVIFIDRAGGRAKLDDEVACQIVAHNVNVSKVPVASPSYQSWLASIGYNGAGSRVAVVDTGCDTNNALTVHQDLIGRIFSIHASYPSTYSEDVDGHGTHVAGIIAGTAAIGTKDANNFLYGQGIAPGSSLIIQNAVATDTPYFPTVSWSTICHDASQDGAIVSNNSWSYLTTLGLPSVNAGYTADCAVFDGFTRDADQSAAGPQPMAFVFSSGNEGPSPNTIAEPKEGKNIIVVGASENYRLDRPLGASCGQSSNIAGVADLSSRGPCQDGRMAPTVVAPGTDISSAVSSSALGYGAYSYGGCRQLVDPLHPDYAWFSGTSMSTPIVSGALAVISQWWRATHNTINPSPAMLKAIVVNSADDMAGGPNGRGGTLGHIPDNDQGWGRLDLANAINPPNTFYDDQEHILTDSGQIRQYRVETVDTNKPLKITLVWTDAPGVAGVHAWTNDLDLQVTGSSGTYLGNVFQNGWSVTGGARDYKNNTECVYIQNPSGVYTLNVIGANIAGDGIPGNAYSLDQDFALVVGNGVVGGPELNPYSPAVQSSAASPDHYAADLGHIGWSAVALKPDSGSASDLTMYSDPGYTAAASTSDLPGSDVDIVAVDGNRQMFSQVYPLVTAITGTGGYTIEWANRTSDIIPGIANTYSFGTSDLIRAWDLNVTESKPCGILVQPTSGNLDLGLSVFASTAGQPSTFYRSRSQAFAHSDPCGPNLPHMLVCQLPTSGRYGIVVWNASGSGTYILNVDTSPPLPFSVTVPNVYTTDLTSLSASWMTSDPESAIAGYQYAVGTSSGASDIVGWTNVGTALSTLISDLSLSVNSTYYVSVRAINGFGMTTVSTSPAVLALQAVNTISAAKDIDNDIPFQLSAKSVSAIYAGKFYLEESDRSSGIGVTWPGSVQESSNVTVVGKLVRLPSGERIIQALQVTAN